MSKLMVLCVDDEKMILNSLKKELEMLVLGQGLDFEVAESGEEALEIQEEIKGSGEIAIIISDQIMPGMKGDELIVRIHQTSPSTINILLTGQADAKAVGNAVNQATLYRYIAKPWESGDLIMTVTEAIKKYKAERQLAEQEDLIENLQANVIENFATSDKITLTDEELYNKTFFARFINFLDSNAQNWVTSATIGLICIDRHISKSEMSYVNALVTVNRDKEYVYKVIELLKAKEVPNIGILRVPNELAFNIMNQMIRIVVSGGRLSKGEGRYLVYLGGRLGIDKLQTQELLDIAQGDIRSQTEKNKIFKAVKSIPLIYEEYT